MENKTIIIEINCTKWLFIKPGIIKTNMQIIHTIYKPLFLGDILRTLQDL